MYSWRLKWNMKTDFLWGGEIPVTEKNISSPKYADSFNQATFHWKKYDLKLFWILLSTYTTLVSSKRSNPFPNATRWYYWTLIPTNEKVGEKNGFFVECVTVILKYLLFLPVKTRQTTLRADNLLSKTF